MTEPSKEVLEAANELWESGSRDAIAAALQKLMDERDAQLAQRVVLLGDYDNMKERAEAAEAERDQLLAERHSTVVHQRCLAAERKLAELIAEVRAQYGQYHVCEKLLARYEVSSG